MINVTIQEPKSKLVAPVEMSDGHAYIKQGTNNVFVCNRIRMGGPGKMMVYAYSLCGNYVVTDTNHNQDEAQFIEVQLDVVVRYA